MGREPDLSRAEKLAVLRRTPIFSSLPRTEDLAARSRSVVVQPGERLWLAGSPATSLAVVLSGRVRLVRTVSLREVLLDIAVPGDVLGEIAFTTRARYQHDAIPLRRARVLLVPAAVVRAGLEEDPRAAIALAFDLAQMLIRLSRVAEDLSSLTVEQRVSRALLRLADRAGEALPDGAVRIPFALRGHDLASLAATTIESVSRKMASWKARGFIESTATGHVLRRPDELRRIAEGG